LPRSSHRTSNVSEGTAAHRAQHQGPGEAAQSLASPPKRSRRAPRTPQHCTQGSRRMKFGIFYEHQLPRPWSEGRELQLFQEALEQVGLADKLGIDFAWEVEHHFLEEYSHSSAPEVFLAAASQRSKRIRLGHGIVLCPPAYNHPARVAERIATLDLVSNGRVEFGTGESASRLEIEGFGVNPTT